MELWLSYVSHVINATAQANNVKVWQRSPRFNPDTHWSASFYKALDQVQYVDGRNILNMNRGDATIRYADYMHASSIQHQLFKGKTQTTRTDYVNRHNSALQTTSYTFIATRTTSEICVEVVKAVPIHKKKPTQHFSDLLMLSEKEKLQPVFQN